MRKNKFVILAVCVIVVSLVYTGVQKAIDNYEFNSNGDIVVAEENPSDEASNDIVNLNGRSEIDDDETDLVLEEVVEDTNEEGSEETSREVADEGTDAGTEAINESKIYVYITGEVNVPGVVILNEGSRIADAINAAGGTTAKANVTKVNLVYVLADGMKVNIPSDSDLKNNPDFEYITMNSGDGGNDDYSGGSSSSNSGSSGASSSNTSYSGSGYSIVNINTATQTELETLPGIGPSLALKIINYRKEKGKFSSIDEIKNVSGIGESKFEALREYITV